MKVVLFLRIKAHSVQVYEIYQQFDVNFANMMPANVRRYSSEENKGQNTFWHLAMEYPQGPRRNGISRVFEGVKMHSYFRGHF